MAIFRAALCTSLCTVVGWLCAALPAHAAVRLPAIRSDHAVLQRAADTPVWGWAEPNEPVTVLLGGLQAATRTGQDGRWRVALDLGAAPATPLTLTVRGSDNEVTASDVLVGEVWLASGQSNMEKPLGEQRGQKPTFDADKEIAAARYPDIRLFKVARAKAAQPGDDVQGRWVRCAPDTVDAIKFSAAAYFFGRRLHTALHAPVGLIDATWGGTRIEPWTPAAAGITAHEAGRLFNGMVAGLAPHAIRGVLWYQGESNIIEDGDLGRYADRMAALVTGWRQHWQRDFAFYYVQVAPHLYHVVRHARVIDPQATPRLWEAQADALRIPGTGMIVTTDLVDDLFDIHPRDKRSVGLRLADVALVQTYGRRDIAASGPVFRAATFEGGAAHVSFDHAVGLATRNGKPPDWFDIAGADGRYYPGSATIEDGKVVVTSAQVPQPVAVRFAWDEAAQPNLVNGARLPARPFRSQRDDSPPAAGP